MSFSRAANVALCSVALAGRTLTPSGSLFIGDMRQRQPSAGAALTLTGTTNGAAYDVYAQTVGGDGYQLVAYPSGTSVAGRIDLIHVGSVLDYPNAGGAQWFPLAGTTLDAYLHVDQYGVHLVPFATGTHGFPYASLIVDPAPGGGANGACFYTWADHASVYLQNYVPGITDMGQQQGMILYSNGLIALQSQAVMQLLSGADISAYFTTQMLITSHGTGAQQTIYDGYARARRTQPTPPSVAVAAAAGVGAGATVYGTDECGRVELTTGTATSGGYVPLFSVNYAHPQVNNTYGVNLSAGNVNALRMSNNQMVASPYEYETANGFIAYVGQQALNASTLYIFNYTVLIA